MHNLAMCVIRTATVLVFASGAGTAAECPSTPDQLSASVSASVRFDPGTKLFRYSYAVANAPSSAQQAWTFDVDVVSPISQIAAPAGWVGMQITARPWVHWAALDTSRRLAPGGSLSGFSFMSPKPPGDATFHAKGYVEVPHVAASSEADAELAAEELVERCPQLQISPLDEGISGRTFGPVDARIVAVDVRPGSDANPVDPGSHGVVPIAILGSPSFDAASVSRPSIHLVPSGAGPVHFSIEDVNGDGILDLMLHFRTDDAQVKCGDTAIVVTAQTTTGARLAGFDTIATVGCR